MSVHTHAPKSSKSSSKSSATMVEINTQAKAETAQARAEYAHREIEMRVKQAELKVEETHLAATLAALHQKRDAEAALTEANEYEATASVRAEERMSASLRLYTPRNTPASM